MRKVCEKCGCIMEKLSMSEGMYIDNKNKLIAPKYKCTNKDCNNEKWILSIEDIE